MSTKTLTDIAASKIDASLKNLQTLVTSVETVQEDIIKTDALIAEKKAQLEALEAEYVEASQKQVENLQHDLKVKTGEVVGEYLQENEDKMVVSTEEYRSLKSTKGKYQDLKARKDEADQAAINEAVAKAQQMAELQNKAANAQDKATIARLEEESRAKDNLIESLKATIADQNNTMIKIAEAGKPVITGNNSK